MADPYTPPGWGYNPSSWSQRLPIAALAFLGFAIAMYLALYQWHVFASVWEPFFGEGSRVILTSSISRLLPIPDAALGAFGYLLDVVAGVIGGRQRWRTMPWMAVIFGLAVGPLGLVSIMLVIFQPILFEAWCTLCLTSALISLVMIGPAMDESWPSYSISNASMCKDGLSGVHSGACAADQEDLHGLMSPRQGGREPCGRSSSMPRSASGLWRPRPSSITVDQRA